MAPLDGLINNNNNQKTSFFDLLILFIILSRLLLLGFRFRRRGRGRSRLLLRLRIGLLELLVQLISQSQQRRSPDGHSDVAQNRHHDINELAFLLDGRGPLHTEQGERALQIVELAQAGKAEERVVNQYQGT